MNIFLTLDFELFLGRRSGGIQSCLLRPMLQIAEIARERKIGLILFVDATYLLRLRELKSQYSCLDFDYREVTQLLRRLVNQGHELQLHIHPQWAYSNFDGQNWNIDQMHYKLSDIPEEKSRQLFRDGCSLLEELSGVAPKAFRAGGFSAQPSSLLTKLLRENDILYDFSVYPTTKYNTAQQQYDYTSVEPGRMYRFEDDLCVEVPNGHFVEVPLSIATVSPIYFWKLVFQRLSKQAKHKRIGDGESVKTAGSSILKRLTRKERIHATIDESKISFLYKAFRKSKIAGHEIFCVIGHPKLATEYSLSKLGNILDEMLKDGAKFVTVNTIDEK